MNKLKADILAVKLVGKALEGGSMNLGLGDLEAGKLAALVTSLARKLEASDLSDETADL